MECGHSYVKLEDYTRLKELLDIDRGIGKRDAIRFDAFKRDSRELYDLVLQRLHQRLMTLAQEPFSERYQNLSSNMFSIAVALTYGFNLTADMKIADFQKVLTDIDELNFNFG